MLSSRLAMLSLGFALAAVPALSPGGIAAYLTLMATILSGLWLIRLRTGRGRGGLGHGRAVGLNIHIV